MASFWSWWIIVLTVATFVGLAWILFANRKGEPGGTEKTTGHVYDGIEELENPLPAWWFGMFVLTMVFGVGYLALYPGLGNFSGMLGWTKEGQYQREVAKADATYREMRDRYLAMAVEDIAQDPAAMRMGGRMFSNNCAQCHGSDARGAYGFPNLTDDDWIYGGTPEAIQASITNGRQAAMPAWGSILGDKGVEEAAAYVLSLNGRDADPALAAAGATHFQTYCSACHGAEGTGNPMLGAPNLTNGIWLYGGRADQIAHSIRAGRNGKMPAHKDMLDEDKIHILTAYVYSLSH
ncbi:cytochrome-c oxidase, cbb3-type subunit III [Haliea sp. E17]|uniref:cytochrome-c oxidase, cbb3-type subunit III n=1 Tax=Haliea sp. E17 TaxID=3401576 RepID=UPI003AAD34FF